MHSSQKHVTFCLLSKSRTISNNIHEGWYKPIVNLFIQKYMPILDKKIHVKNAMRSLPESSALCIPKKKIFVF